MLHQAAVNKKKRHELVQKQKESQIKKVANRGVHKNVNHKSDAVLVKQFYEHFCKII